MSKILDVTYEKADLELVPASLFKVFNTGYPNQPIRLVLSNYLPALIMVVPTLVYWFYLIPHYFPSTRPTTPEAITKFKKSRDTHNLGLFIYSGVCTVASGYYMYVNDELFDWHKILCVSIEGTWMRALSTTFCISKLVEWIDTAYIIWLGKTPPQFLHKYHHATTFWLYCLIMNFPATEKLGMFLNGGVHTLMYSHYWRSWNKKLVPLITILQIMQLATLTYAWHATPGECSADPVKDVVGEHFLEFITPYAMVPVFLAFFIKFFVERYVLKRAKGVESGKEQKAKAQ